MCPVTSGRHKIPMVRNFASAAMILGLLAPGPTTTPWNDAAVPSQALFATPLAEARPPGTPSGGTVSCGDGRRELRFGWIEPGEETPPLARLGVAACLAVYHPTNAPRPDISRQ
jgi:hypothetical protein